MSDTNQSCDIKEEPGLDIKTEKDNQPPLPAEQPPHIPSPPPSEQTPNQNVEGLEIDDDRAGSQTTGSPPPKRRKTSDDSHADLEEDPNSFVIREDTAAAEDAGTNVQEDFDSLEDGELEESEGEAAFGRAISPVMAMNEDSAIDPPDSPPHEIISFVGETIDENARPNAGMDGPDTEFEIIDDIGSDGEKGDGEGVMDDGSGGYLDDEEDFSMDEDEIDAMLDGGIAQYQKDKAERERHQGEGSNAPLEKEKIVLKERGHDPFDILPEGWVVVTHNSGMPIYLHKQSRVCTLSRPYFLGPGSARKHEIPLSAIPCLSYRRALEKEKADADNPESSRISENIPQQNGDISDNAAESAQTEASQSEDQTGKDKEVPSVKIESAEEHKKENNLNPIEVQDYCQNLFEFKTITVKRFKTWKDRRKHNTALKKASRPLLPSATKLITCPIASEKEDSKPSRKKEFVLNPTGKSHVCILHEYVQHSMRVQPKYIFKEIDNGNTPYSATVVIDEIQYGTGFASSKKAAKIEAARKTLEVLIPDMVKVTEEDKKSNTTDDLAYFDEVKIEDPRVTELFMKAGQPSPFQILYECLKRNYGIGDSQVEMDMKALKHQRSEFRMKVGKHEAKVPCKNKREGKQQAAQAILKMMHPHVHTWGSLLRLYGRSSGAREKKDEKLVMKVGWEGEITIDLGSPVWDLKRDRAHIVDISRCVEIIDVNPHDPPIKSEPMETDVKNEFDDISPLLEKIDPITLRTVIMPLMEPWQEVFRDVPKEETVLDEAKFTRLLHAAVQTDTPLGICLTVGDICHMASQTEWEGTNLFHKAVQMPETSYSAEEGEQEFKKPSTSSSNIKMATSYTSTSSGQRKQMVLVEKPDGGVTYVPLAPKTHGPDSASEDKKDEGKSDDANAKIFPESSGSSGPRLTSSPLQGTSNVYFASGAIKPFTPPAVDEGKDGFIGPLHEKEDKSGDKPQRFVPRTVGYRKPEDERMETIPGTATRTTPSTYSAYSSAASINQLQGADHLTSSYLSRQVSPSRPYGVNHAVSQAAMMLANSRAQVMMAGTQLGGAGLSAAQLSAAQLGGAQLGGAQLGMPGAGLMGSMPAALAAPSRHQLGLQGMAGVTPGMEQLAAYQTAAAVGYGSGAAVLPNVYYQQAMHGVQQPMVLQQQPQSQAMYYCDPTTGQWMYGQM